MPSFTNPLANSAPAAAAPVSDAQAAARAAPVALNSRPNKDANSSQSPGMMGDVKKNPTPPQNKVAASPPSPATQRGQSYQHSGMERALGDMANKLHPPKRR